MKQVWMSGAAVVMAVSMATLGAQQQPPTQQPPTTPPTTQPPTTQPPTTTPPTTTPTPQTPTMASQDTAMTTTIQGCVYKEEAVPGRTPNVAERAGVLEDYILVASADTSMTAGTSGTTPPTTTPPTTTPPTGTTGTAGAATSATKAYKLEKIADEQLRAVVGKRVEVTGRIDKELSDTGRTGAATGTTGAPARDRSLGPDQIELPEFEVTSIREVEGTCPATPNIRK